MTTGELIPKLCPRTTIFADQTHALYHGLLPNNIRARTDVMSSLLKSLTFLFLLAVASAGCEDSSRRVQDAVAIVQQEKVANVGWGGAGAISADGRLLVHGENGRVVLLDLDNGLPLFLTDGNDGDPREFAISPNNKTIVFASHADGCTLKAIDCDGDNARVLVDDPTVDQIVSLKWTPDGEYIAAVLIGKNWAFVRPILIHATDGSQQDLNLNAQRFGPFDFSTDSRYIAFFSSNRGSSAAKLMLHDRETDATTVIVEHPERCVLLGWTPLGDAIIYARFRGSDPEVWAQRLQNGEAKGQAEFLETRISSKQLHTDRMKVIGMTRSGDCYVGGPAWVNDVYLVDCLAECKADCICGKRL
jgi:WD40 repeat protein